mmetsp:Transcript_25298/g.29790  ORF Transcript_25298/g.29790 Transcript_25298/m.29790 type:complete len:327 (+) Transcript_25298:62-1042(+)
MAEGTEPISAKELVSSLNEHSDGTNIVKESINILSSNPDGLNKKGDLMSDTTENALIVLKELIELNKTEAKKEKMKKRWDFRTSPHEQFGKEIDDTFMAFLLWSRVSTDEDDTGSSEKAINVSKAFRRLESYADWMDQTGDDLTTPQLTPASVQSNLEAWAMRVSTDNQGRLVWWVDFDAFDLKKIKEEMQPEDSLRAFVWYAHYIMYNKNAQENGLVFVENLAYMGMVKCFTIVPLKLSAKVDRLTIGVLPIKMNAYYILEVPTWVNVFMKLIGVFVSKQIMERLVYLKEWDKLEDLLGKDCIPTGFGKLAGSLKVDPVVEKYFT